MWNLGNMAIAGGSLGAADYLTENVVSSTLWEWIKTLTDNVSWNVHTLISGSGSVATGSPVLGSAADVALWATGIVWAYKGITASSKSGIIQWVKEGSLWYSIPASAMALLGLTANAPWAAALWAVWLWIHGLQKVNQLRKTFMEHPGENLKYGITQPFKSMAGGIKRIFSGKNNTPSA